MEKKKIIVKVQLSLFPKKDQKRGLLIYDENRTFNFEGEAPFKMVALMEGRDKAFFYAWVEGTDLVIDEEAPYQDW